MQQQLWLGAAGAALLAVISGLAERRRGRREHMDAVGFVPWQLLQVMAMLGAVVLVSVALNLHQ